MATPNKQYQFDLLYVPNNVFGGNTYKYTLTSVDAASRYEVTRASNIKKVSEVSHVLKQPLNYGLALKKVYKVIKFNQNAWLKPYIDMNTKLRKKAKNNFDKDFFKLMNNALAGKTIKNVRKHRNIKLITTERWRNYLVFEPNYKTTKFFTENTLAKEILKTEKTWNTNEQACLCIRSD